jgi:hypothetical protein
VRWVRSGGPLGRVPGARGSVHAAACGWAAKVLLKATARWQAILLAVRSIRTPEMGQYRLLALLMIVLCAVLVIAPIRHFLNHNSGVLTSVVGALVLIVYWRQTNIMEGQLNAATAAATAASKAADVAEEALRLGERPYLFVTPIHNVLQYAINDANPQNTWEPFRAFGRQPFVTFNIINYGKTPAILHEISANLKISTILPLRQDLSKIMPQASIVISTGHNTSEVTCEVDNWDANAHRTTIANGHEHFWLVGEIKYDDIFGNVTVSGFCFRYHVATKSFHEDGGDAYNFQSTTKRSALSDTTRSQGI